RGAYQKDTSKALRSSRRRPWPIYVACFTNVSDGDIVNCSVGIAISPLSYYRCRDNLYQVRTMLTTRFVVNQEGGKTLTEFPNSIELGKLGPSQDPNNKEHSTTSLVHCGSFRAITIRTARPKQY
ncbi:hypothetical protein CFP56_011726, partial [Quercus suber]